MNQPRIESYHRHALMCAGKSCGENIPLFKYFKALVEAEDLGKLTVRINRAGCLGVCQQGPVMVVYPEGIWYYALNEAKLTRIVEEHFRQGNPVMDYAFHCQPLYTPTD